MRKILTLMLSLVSATFGLGLFLTLCLCLTGGVPPTVQAAPLATTWYVDGTGDDGNDCLSLVNACQTVDGAVSKAADGDTILVAGGVYTENLDISKDLTLTGAGRESTVLNGNQAGRVLRTTGRLTLQNFTLRNGLTEGSGGGIFNNGDLTLSNTLVISNSGYRGGGIYNRDTLLLRNSAVVSNTASNNGGGLYNYSSAAPPVITLPHSLIAGNRASQGGGLYNYTGEIIVDGTTIRDNFASQTAGGLGSLQGRIVLSGTTVDHNEAIGDGGGVYVDSTVFTMTNSTLSGNLAHNYGALHIRGTSPSAILNSTFAYNQRTDAQGTGGIGASSSATMYCKNTIVAHNDGEQCFAAATWVSEGYNLSSDDQCGFTQPGDLPNTDPLLAPLADYGGATLTHALLPGSPAIDAGTNDGCPPADQRGVARPFDGDHDGTATCDIGSYEVTSQLAVLDVTVLEGDGGPTYAVLTVTLAPTNTQAITVDYATATGGATGSATAGDDFAASSGTLTFAVGQATQFITVTINGDTDDEPDETFTVNLSNAPDAHIVDGQATVTIIDDDGLPSLTISDQSVTEGDDGTIPAVFAVSLSPASADTVTMDYTTADGEAMAGSDYTAAKGTLTFLPGATSQFITVTVKGDTVDEGAGETFTVDLITATNANLTDAQGVGTITDDDAAQLSIAPGPQIYEGHVGTTPATFTVTLSTPTSFAATVDYETNDGYGGDAAVAGSDYQAISGTLTFAPGQVTCFITVPVIGDRIDEPQEDFWMRLSNPHPIGGGGSARALILNDDIPIYLPLIIR